MFSLALGTAIRWWHAGVVASHLIDASKEKDPRYIQAAMRWSQMEGDMVKVLSTTALMPFTVMQTRLMTDFGDQNRHFSGLWNCFKRSGKMEGRGVFWRGLAPLFLGHISASAGAGACLILGGFVLRSSEDNAVLMPIFLPLSIFVSTAFMQPFLIVSNQKQVAYPSLPAYMRPKILGSNEELRGFGSSWQLLKLNYQRYGLRRGLFRGLTVTLIYSALSQPTLWLLNMTPTASLEGLTQVPPQQP